MNPIDKPTEHDEYNELLSVVGDIVDAGHMDQEHLARLRAHLGCRPDPAGVVREVASRESVATIRRGGSDTFGRAQVLVRWEAGAESLSDGEHKLYAAQGAVEREPSGDALDAARYRWLCANNFDRKSTQVQTWLQTWEPNSVTGEPTEWKQRIHGAHLDVIIDAAITAARQEPK